MLKFYVKMGAKVTETYRVNKFKQGYICRDYIGINTENRITAKNEAKKCLGKLMVNSLFERMCINPLQLLQSKFVRDPKR